MTSREKTYEAMSPKIAAKRKAKLAAALREGPKVPATVDNFRVNNPKMARSLNIQPVSPKQRSLAKTEGMPAVNGKSGKEVIKKAVKPVGSRVMEVNPADAAIKPKNVKKKGTQNDDTARKKTTRRRTRKSKEVK